MFYENHPIVKSVIGEVFGIYVSAGDRNVRWSLLIGWFALRTYLDSGLMAMCFWRSKFSGCLFSLLFCSIGFYMAGNLNDIALMWCLFSCKLLPCLSWFSCSFQNPILFCYSNQSHGCISNSVLQCGFFG